MINRYDRLGTRLSSSALLGKTVIGTSVWTTILVRALARGSNRFKPIRIRITLNRFHVRQAGKQRWVVLSLRVDQLTSCSDLASFRIACLISRAPSSDHTFRDEESLVSRVQKRQLAWEHQHNDAKNPEKEMNVMILLLSLRMIVRISFEKWNILKNKKNKRFRLLYC